MISAILAASLAFLVGAWLSYIVLCALRSGVARIAGGREFKRKKSVWMYWTTVTVQSLFSALMIIVGIMRLTKI